MVRGKIELERGVVLRSPRRLPSPQLTKLPQLTGHKDVARLPLTNRKRKPLPICNEPVGATPPLAKAVKPVATAAAVGTPVAGEVKPGHCRPTKTPLAPTPPSPVVAPKTAAAPAGSRVAPPPPPIVATAPATAKKTTTCSVCGRLFTNSSSLQKHAPVHLPLNRPFKCTECIEHYFSNKGSLTRHTNEIHVTKAPLAAVVPVVADRRMLEIRETSKATNKTPASARQTAVIKPMQHSQAVVTPNVTNASKLLAKPTPLPTSSSKSELVTTSAKSTNKSKRLQQSSSKQNSPELSSVIAEKSTSVASSNVPPTKSASAILQQIATVALPKVESEPTISKNSPHLTRNNKAGQKMTPIRKYANIKEAITHFMQLVDGYKLDDAERVANTLKPVDSGDLLIVQNMHQLCRSVDTIVSKKRDVPLDVLLLAHMHAIECIGNIVPQSEHKKCHLRKGLISRAIRFTIQHYFNREAFELCRMLELLRRLR